MTLTAENPGPYANGSPYMRAVEAYEAAVKNADETRDAYRQAEEAVILAAEELARHDAAKCPACGAALLPNGAHKRAIDSLNCDFGQS